MVTKGKCSLFSPLIWNRSDWKPKASLRLQLSMNIKNLRTNKKQSTSFKPSHHCYFIAFFPPWARLRSLEKRKEDENWFCSVCSRSVGWDLEEVWFEHKCLERLSWQGWGSARTHAHHAAQTSGRSSSGQSDITCKSLIFSISFHPSHPLL